MSEYECALSGITEAPSEESNSDGLDDLPVGWTKVTIARRQFNPKWLMIQQVKEAMVEGLLSQIPAEMQESQRFLISVQVDAQFHGIESATSMYIRDVDDVVYLSDSGDIADSINEVRQLLGLDALAQLQEEEATEPASEAKAE